MSQKGSIARDYARDDGVKIGSGVAIGMLLRLVRF